jgi:hypothetical protein
MADNIQIKNISGRVGSYAISTVDLNSFTNDTLARPMPKGRRNRNNKEVIHKIFAECAAVTDDPFWREKFNLASCGKFPSKFSYNDGILTYRKGAKNNAIELPANEHEAAELCMNFFRTNGGIFSELDQQYSLQLQYNRSQDVATQEPLEWKALNKKMQECLLSYYVMGMKTVMNLKETEVEQMRQTLHLGIKNKLFGKNNIHVEQNRIQSIDGLLWNNDGRYFFINPELKPGTVRNYNRKKDTVVSQATNCKDMMPQFNAKWGKYTEALTKKVNGRVRAQRRIRVVHQSITTPRRTTLITTDTTTLSPRTSDTPDNTDITDAEDEEDSDE